MAKYIVKGGQTLFDVALNLYGTIEGLFDLLISNERLSMTTDLMPGMELEYHEEFIINSGIVNRIKDEKRTIANGERHVYNKSISQDLVAIIRVSQELNVIEFSASGEGIMYVDWGDNSNIEEIPLSHSQRLISHYLDNQVEDHRMYIYGSFSLQCLDITRLKGNLYLTRPMVIDEFICQSNDNMLHSLFLFKGTYSVNLENMLITDLSPIYSMSLAELRLTGARFQEPKTLNDYLVYISENYGSRRACKVYIDNEPSVEGLEAIKKILKEPEWNEPDRWEFYINGNLYTISDGTDTD